MARKCTIKLSGDEAELLMYGEPQKKDVVISRIIGRIMQQAQLKKCVISKKLK